jgi:hypothetical protein
MSKHGVSKVIDFYMSLLEHEWVIIIEAESAHGIGILCAGSEISSFNTFKIVPLNNLRDSEAQGQVARQYFYAASPNITQCPSMRR